MTTTFMTTPFDKQYFEDGIKTGVSAYEDFRWIPERTLREASSITNNIQFNSVLDFGCAKGFMLYDFKKLNKNFELHGVDISKYAITSSIEDVRQNLKIADAQNLPYEDNYFDLVISINTIHNLSKEGCSKSLKEIQRVTKKNSFITVDAYRNEEEKKRMLEWNLTAKTIMPVSEWIKFFKKEKYNGDYYWFIP
jgi:ubiquinone/menaquinone biosynthesis C-methylase UbiE